MVAQVAALTPKGERTRERILDTALALFADQGYEATTMRDIAGTAGCSLGLAYRYFTGKEDLVLALYGRLAENLEAAAGELPPGTIADRFARAMQIKLALVAPHRAPLGALFAATLTPSSGIAVFGAGTGDVRARVEAVFHLVVSGAADALRGRQAEDLATVLYAGHLALLLFSFHDRTPDGRATREVVAFARDTLALVRPFLRLPPVARALARLARALRPVIGAPVEGAGVEDGDR